MVVKYEKNKKRNLLTKKDMDLDEKILKYLNDGITYTAKNLDDLLDYFRKIDTFEDNHKKLCELISHIKILNIDRVEYDRKACIQENVDKIIDIVENIKSYISSRASEDEKLRIQNIEKELDKEYLYAKDIELLKKMISFENKEIDEEYDCCEKVNTVSINIKDNISSTYILVETGSIEYHYHLDNNIPRIKRLIKNLHKYIVILLKRIMISQYTG